jgi:hypothetical protein
MVLGFGFGFVGFRFWERAIVEMSKLPNPPSFVIPTGSNNLHRGFDSIGVSTSGDFHFFGRL